MAARPRITSAANLTVAENNMLVHTLMASQPVTWAKTGGADAALFSLVGSSLTLLAQDYEHPADADANNVYIVTVRATNSSGKTASQTITFTITSANEFTPVIISNGGGSTASVSVAENGTAVTTVQATDADAGAMLTYSIIGGADQSKFTIDSSTGVLRFVQAPDFETPTDADSNNQYIVQVQVSDGVLSDTQTITVTVTDVVEGGGNSAPVITSNGGGSTASISIAENSTAVTTVTATDADLDTLTYSIVGGADQAKFTINSSSGVLAFASGPNFESPTDANTDNQYIVQVQVSDGTATDTQTITVTVTNVNEFAPVITSNGAGSTAAISVAENTTAVTTVTATDADTGATLTYSIIGGADAAKFTINSSSGALAFVSAPDFETPTDANTDNAYIVQVQVSDGTSTDTQTITVTVTDVVDESSALVTSFIVKNTGGSTLTTPQVSFFQPLAPGAVPSGNKLELRANDGTTVIPMQQDQEPVWASDGSWKGAAVSFVAPDSPTAGQQITYKLYSVSGAPNRTGAVSLATLAANSDFKVQFTGQDLSTDIFEVNVNAIIADNNNWPWGANPMMGYEVIRVGPTCCEWRFWSYLRRNSDSAWHKWLKGWIYVRAWGATGPFEVSSGVRQSNTFGPSASGTVGAATEPKHVFDVKVMNGATVLQYWGGTSDPRVQSVSASAFDPTANNITIAYPNTLTNNSFGGQALTLSGTVGSGLSTSTVYWLSANPAGPTIIYLYTARQDIAVFSPVDFTTQGSGTISIIPHCHCYPFTGQMYLDNTARPFWVSGTRPTVAVAHDYAYLTKQSKAIPPYLSNVTVDNITSEFFENHSPGMQIYTWDINAAGSGIDDERIGYNNISEVRALYNPFDENNNQRCRVMAATFAEQHTYLEDETIGLVTILNNGPAKNGATYSNLGVCQPTSRAVPFRNNMAWLQPSASAIDQDGIYERYGVWLGSAAHLPMPGQIPYLQSGNDFWREYMMHLGLMNAAQLYYATVAVGATTYYRPLGVDVTITQSRGVAWGTRLIGQTNHFMPASSPLAAYIQDLTVDNGAYAYAWSQTPHALDSGTGAVSLNGVGPQRAIMGFPLWYSTAEWQESFNMMVMGMEGWRDPAGPYASFINQFYYKSVIGIYDSTIGNGGCLYTIGHRNVMPWNPESNRLDDNYMLTDFNDIFTYTSAYQAGTGDESLPVPWVGCPASGLGGDPGGPSVTDSNSLVNLATCGLALWSLLDGGSHAVTLYDTIRARQGGGLSFTNYPQWSVAPLAAVV